MKKIDGRKLSTEAQQQLRYTAVKLRKENMTYAKIAKMLNISLSSVYNSCKKYKTGGKSALEIKKRGVLVGTNRKLSKDQTEKLRKILIDKTPDQLELNFSLWTRQAIQNLTFKLWSIHIPLRTITDYMYES